jgi:hypothetical protein
MGRVTPKPERVSTWETIEAGWYTLHGVGAIVHERNGWYFYPLQDKRVGPFRTLAAAKIAAPKARSPRDP